MSFRAVLFDLDGTLLDTIEVLADSVNGALESLALPVHPTGAYLYFVGDGITMLARRALPEDRRDDEAAVRALIEATRNNYAAGYANKTRPYEGVPEMLDGLAARGLPLAILSNKPHDFTLRCVEELLPHWRFALVIGQRDGVPVKPDPGAALAIAGELAVDPADFLYLGDTGTDMRTATGAGMYAVGATWGFRPVDELKAAGAKALVNHPHDVIDLVRRA